MTNMDLVYSKLKGMKVSEIRTFSLTDFRDAFNEVMPVGNIRAAMAHIQRRDLTKYKTKTNKAGQIAIIRLK